MGKYKKIYMFMYLYTLLIVFDVELLRNGFNKAFTKYANKFSLREVTTDEVKLTQYANEIFQLFDILDIVCAWYPKKADCIHKSFLGYKVVRRKFGIPVDIVIGLRKFPFEAHAWLQINNLNFFGDDDQTSKYKIILSTNIVREGDYY